MNIPDINNRTSDKTIISNESEVKSLNDITQNKYIEDNPFNIIMYSQWMQDIFIPNGDEDDSSSEW